MTMPGYEKFMLPIMDMEREYEVSEVRDKLAGHFKITEEDLWELLPSGEIDGIP